MSGEIYPVGAVVYGIVNREEVRGERSLDHSFSVSVGCGML